MWHARLNLEFLCDLYILGSEKVFKEKSDKSQANSGSKASQQARLTQVIPYLFVSSCET